MVPVADLLTRVPVFRFRKKREEGPHIVLILWRTCRLCVCVSLFSSTTIGGAGRDRAQSDRGLGTCVRHRGHREPLCSAKETCAPDALPGAFALVVLRAVVLLVL